MTMAFPESALEVLQTPAGMIENASALPHVLYAFQSHSMPKAKWSVAHFELHARHSHTYRVELVLTSADENDDGTALLGTACSVVVRRGGRGQCVHGIVSRVAVDGAAAARSLQVTLVPALEALRHRIDCRIFPEMTVPEVLDSVLAPGLAKYGRKYQSKLRRAAYPRREYIVQYRESDLAFAERLMAEEGIWYRFEHTVGVSNDDCEVLLLHDANADAPDAELGESGSVLSITLGSEGDALEHETVYSLHLEQRQGAENVAVAQYNWTHPNVWEEAEAPGGLDAQHERYEPHGVTLWDYQGERYLRSDARDQARLRWERHQGQAEVLRGKSNLASLAVGQRVEVRDTTDALDGAWIITALDAYGASSHGAEHGRDYGNRFQAQRALFELRPERRAKPRAEGVTLAHVVGPDGKPSHAPGDDDLHTDEHGRVRVKMSWDRTLPGTEDATTSCFLRVTQLWGGDGWGAMFLPRIGMEVVVGFVDGDPDRPLITGCLYNGLARVPHAQDANKTKSYIRTRSTPGGDGYNELLFEDAAGSELVSLRAQRDHKEDVLHDQTLSIGHDRSEVVKGKEQVDIAGARTHVVHGAETLRVVDGSARLVDLSGDETTLIAKNRELVVSQKSKETHAGSRKVLVELGDELEVVNGAHKRTHVSGQYNITADEHFKVKQGRDELYMKDTFYVRSEGDVQLRNGGFHLHADPKGNTTLDVDKQLTIRVGGASIQLKSDGTIIVSGMKTQLVTGPAKLELSQTGMKLAGPRAAIAADALIELKARMITLN